MIRELVNLDKYGDAVYDIEKFSGFKNYSKSREEIVELVNLLYVYLKMSRGFYYFEHNDYETYGYGGENNVRVKMDWVVFGFDDVDNRDTSLEGDFDDLVIAIDVLEDGRVFLRFHSPKYCRVEFDNVFKIFENYRGNRDGYFYGSREEYFLFYIRELMKIL